MSSCKSSMLSGFPSKPLLHDIFHVYFMISCLIPKATEKISRNSEVLRSVLAVYIELSEPEGAQLLAVFMTSSNNMVLLYRTSDLDCWGGLWKTNSCLK